MAWVKLPVSSGSSGGTHRRCASCATATPPSASATTRFTVHRWRGLVLAAPPPPPLPLPLSLLLPFPPLHLHSLICNA
eukprot:COSAG01_NODE_108_length_25947_cov_25.489593_9_plen_78_part_00